MPQPSYPYACARISALEKGLVGKAAIKRMADGSLDDAMRTLLDARYGGIPDATNADIERMIDGERIRAAREIQEISPDPKLTDLFLLSTDVHNLKVLLKARCLGTSEVAFLEGGLYEREQLERFVSEQDYAALPEKLAESLVRLEERLRMRVEPQRISVMLDYGYLAHCMEAAKKIREPFVRQYFTAMCDFDNLITFLRLRAMGSAKEDLKEMLLPQGEIAPEKLLEAYELSSESLVAILEKNSAREALSRGLNEMLRSGNIGALEKERDNYLLSLVNAHRHDSTTIFPVVGYYLARQREAQAIRLIVTVKKNGLDDGVIAERLRELYG